MRLLEDEGRACALRVVRLAMLAVLLLLASSAQAATGAAPRKLALLVGVGKYARSGPQPWPNLKTHDDVTLLKQVLMSRFDFAEADIVVLEDERATGAGIRRAFREHLIEKAQPGATVVFHFSGHGQQILDDNGDETDGLDESLVPHDTADMRAEQAAKTNLRDDEIHDWLQKLQSRMSEHGKVVGSITVFVDSCFSGTITRGILSERGRGWDANLDGRRPTPRARSAQKGATGLLPAGAAETQGYVVLSATQSDQTAKEADGMGVFTRALVSTLSRATSSMTYRELWERITFEVESQRREQSPQIEGRLDALLFSGSARPLPEHLRVIASQADRITLPVGDLHGASVGSTWSLYSAGSGPLDAQSFLGDAVIESVEAFRSVARLRGNVDPSKLAAARAREKEHVYENPPLRLHLRELESLPELVKKIREQGITTEQGATVEHYDLQIERSAKEGKLLVRRASAARPFATVTLDNQAAQKLVEILRGEWRWQRLMKLRQDNPAAQVRLRVVPVEVTLNAQGHPAAPPRSRRDLPAAEHVNLREGDFFQLEFQNITKTPLYVSVLELSTDGSIEPLFPTQDNYGDNLIPADGKPHLANYQPFVFRVGGDPGRSVLKLIATREPVSFSPLIYRATTPNRGSDDAILSQMSGAVSPLGHLLRQIVGTERKATAIGVAPASFGTVDASYTLLPLN